MENGGLQKMEKGVLENWKWRPYKDGRTKKLSSFSAADIQHFHPHIPVHACKLHVWGENFFRDM